MFVTSDIFNLQKITQHRAEPWRECLMGGVAVHGARWPGPEAVARFLSEAAKLSGLTDQLKYAGYGLPQDRRTRPIAPKSIARLGQGRLSGAMGADVVFARGEHIALGIGSGYLYFGGSANGYDNAAAPESVDLNSVGNRSLWGHFCWPYSDNYSAFVPDLLRLAVSQLGAEYGYGFVRDEFCFVEGYVSGIAGPVGRDSIALQDAEEIRGWRQFGRRELWGNTWPKLRDLYQVNLLSERHTAKPVEGLGYLADWIEARPGRGRLTDIGQGRLIWRLTDAELFNTRPLLNEAGLLVTCHERVYRDLQIQPSA